MTRTRGRATPDAAPDVMDRGAVAIIVAVFTIVAMVLLAFVVDRGLVYANRAQLQNAVDAAALAAVQETCANPIASPASVRAVAVNYGAQNGVTVDPADVIVQDGPNDATTGVSVAAETVVRSLFGGFAGVGDSTVAARGTATRACRSSYQFVAERFTNFNGGKTVGGNIYGGECFDGAGGNFQTVAVWRPINYNCPPPHNGSTPIDPGSGGVVADPLYSQPLVTPSGTFDEAIENTGYTKAILDALVYQSNCGSFSGSAFTSPSSPLVCSGTGSSNADVLDLSGSVSRWIVAEGEIDVAGTTYTGTGPWVIYSKNGNIDITASLANEAIVFAPKGTVTINGSSTTVNGVVLSKDIVFNGGSQDAGNSVSVRTAGDWRLSQ